MSASRTSARLLRLYPPAWRARYGEELGALIVEAGDGGRVPWRVRADVVRAGTVERLRAAGLSRHSPPGEQARGGVLLVLWAWALFVLAGAAVQKTSEHWQEATPAANRALPAAAFATLVTAAVCGGALVLAGIAAAAPSAVAFLRAGGWREIRGRVLAAAALTAVAGAATVALVVWAHGLTPRARAGHDTAYAIAFVAWALAVAACLLAWTAAAVALGRRLALPARTLKLEARLSVAVTAAMCVMTAATAVWWPAVAGAAPGFLGSAQLAAAAALMVAASVLGAIGSRRAVRAPARCDGS